MAAPFFYPIKIRTKSEKGFLYLMYGKFFEYIFFLLYFYRTLDNECINMVKYDAEK